MKRLTVKVLLVTMSSGTECVWVTRFYSFLCGYLNRSLGFCWYNFTLNGLVSTFPEISVSCFG